MYNNLDFIYNDGGRSKYFKGEAGDCVTRAICNATGFDYKEVYTKIKKLIGKTPRDGVSKKDTRRIMDMFGFRWVSTMDFGTGCTTHLREEDLPSGIIICQLTHHLTCVKNKVIYDTYDPSRDGTRCVYGYWIVRI